MVNNHNLWDFCIPSIGRADIEESKSYVDLNSLQLQASYPCGNFSDTSGNKFHSYKNSKGSQDHTFMFCIHTENQNKNSFCSYTLQIVSVDFELFFEHLRCHLKDVPPQPNSQVDYVNNKCQKLS